MGWAKADASSRQSGLAGAFQPLRAKLTWRRPDASATRSNGPSGESSWVNFAELILVHLPATAGSAGAVVVTSKR